MTADGVLPNASVGAAGQFDQILVVVLRDHLPALLGSFGVLLAALIMVSIMAAAMSTADSNLHALSAILTRDIFDRFISPNSSQQTRTWVGRSIIGLATILSVFIVIVSRTSATINLVGMIAQLGLLAIAFSSQLLPITFDILFVKRGTREGAVAGLMAGLLVVVMQSPLLPVLTGETSGFATLMGTLRSIFDIGAWGLIVNTATFAIVSLITKQKTMTLS
jgi:SSS family solute:Na+ symporter